MLNLPQTGSPKQSQVKGSTEENSLEQNLVTFLWGSWSFWQGCSSQNASWLVKCTTVAKAKAWLTLFCSCSQGRLTRFKPAVHTLDSMTSSWRAHHTWPMASLSSCSGFHQRSVLFSHGPQKLPAFILVLQLGHMLWSSGSCSWWPFCKRNEWKRRKRRSNWAPEVKYAPARRHSS